MPDPPHQPKFCPQCGAGLPPSQPRFCIECGAAIKWSAAPAPAPPTLTKGKSRPTPAAPTVQLPNARVAQAVIGGTVRLPTDGAVPPGLWVRDEPPGPEDVVALYPPLRPLAEGWSGLIGRGWSAYDRTLQSDGNVAYRFVADAAWFPAPGCGGGRRLRARLLALELSKQLATRQGFRYRLGTDPPLELLEANWYDEADQPLGALPLPQIQLMAPPRVPRFSDFAEDVVEELTPPEAERWAAGTLAPGLYRLGGDAPAQMQTPAGRGLILRPALPASPPPPSGLTTLLARVFKQAAPEAPPRQELYQARTERPYRSTLRQWRAQLRQVRKEAQSLGLDLTPELVAEWWLDRQGHDALWLSETETRYGTPEVLIVFRRAQIARVIP